MMHFFISVLLFTIGTCPVWASSDSNKSSFPFIMTAIFLWGIWKSFKASRQPDTQTSCALALMWVLISWLVASVGRAPVFDSINPIYVGVASFLCVIVAFIQAIVGLSVFKLQPHVTKGKRMAISAIVFCLIMFTVFGFGLFNGFQKRANSEIQPISNSNQHHVRDEKLNFEYSLNYGSYVQLDADKINPDASIILMQRKPQIMMALIAESFPQDAIDLDMLEELVKGNLRSVDARVIISPFESLHINGYQGRTFTAELNENGYHLLYIGWVYIHNGFAYQVMSWSKGVNRDKLKHEFPHLLAGFHLLSHDVVSMASDDNVIEKTPDTFESNLGVRVDLRDSMWLNWPSLKDSYPKAEFGAATLTDASFLVVPYCYGSHKPDDGAIKYSLFNAIGIDYLDDGIVLQGNVPLGNQTAEKIEHVQQKGDSTEFYSDYVVIDAECAYLISTVSLLNKDELQKLYQDLNQRVQFHSLEKSMAIIEMMPPRKLALSKLYYSTGIYYYNRENWKKAKTFFAQAAALDRTSEMFLNQTLSMYNHLRQYNAGIGYIKENAGELAASAVILSWQAWFHFQLDQKTEARQFFAQAFAAGYREDEELNTYVNLLLDENLLDDAEYALENFATDRNALHVQRAKADILHRKGESDAALALLQKAQQKSPLNHDLIFDQIYIYEALGRYNDVLSLTKKLVSAGEESAGAYYRQGKAQYMLGWLTQAKQSMESALLLSPNNSTVQQYLDEINGVLGQGDSSLILREINPVLLPVSLKAADMDTSGYDSFYETKSKAIYFKIGEPLRETRHQLIRVVTLQGVERFNTLKFQFDPWFERAYVNRLIVKDSQGKVVAEGIPSDYYVLDANDEQADTDKIINIPVPQLAEGYLIDLMVTTESLQPVSSLTFQRQYLSATRPIGIAALYLTGDVEQVASSASYTNAAKHVKHGLLWQHRSPPIYQWEPMAVDQVDYLPSVTLSQKGLKWQAIGNAYFQKIQDKLKQESALQQLAKRITKSAKDNKAKVAALSRYVQENIVYKALEFGQRGQIPNTPMQTVQNRYGDCKDHAVLLHGLLNSIGIPNHLALVNLSDQVSETMPSLDQFDHMIVYVPDVEQGLYIDATDKNLDLLAYVPPNLAKTHALLIDEKQSKLSTLPEYKMVNIDIQRTIDANEKGMMKITEEVRLNGYFASYMREYLKGIESAKYFNWASRFLTDLAKHLELKSFELENLNVLEKPLIMKLTYNIPTSVLDSNQILLSDPAVWETYYLLPELTQNRLSDFRVTYPLQLSSRVSYLLPSENALLTENALAPVQVDSSYGKVWVNHTLENNKMTRTLRFQEFANRYRKENYESYLRFIKKTLSNMTEAIHIKGV